MDHGIYDKRNYPIVDVQEGYGEWAHTYEQDVLDEMDLQLFNTLQSVDWSAQKLILDLACGTGRIGIWLKEHTDATLDGLDITPEMLEQARRKTVYRNLYQASVTDTELEDAAYDLCTQSLADEHLPDLKSLYKEAARITQLEGYFVLVGFHPQFIMAGMPTHYDRTPDDQITIRTYVHLFSHHVQAANEAGWTLREMHEVLVDDAWLEKKPKWQKYYGLPISFVMVWQK